MKLKLDKQSVYILLLAILFSVAILLLIFYNLSSQKRTSRLISHSREEIEQIETVLLLMQDCETGSRGFVITNDEKFQEPYKSALQKLPKVLIRIKELTRDQVVQQKNFTTLSYLVQKKIEISQLSIDTRIKKGLNDALQLVAAGNGKITMDSIRIVVGEMLAFESNLLSKRKVENEKALANTSLILFTIIILFIVLLFLYLKKIWKYLRVKRSASEALKESHERFNFVSKATSDVVWDWELKTGNLLWGDNFEILFGHQLENPLVHISYWDNFIHPDDKQRIADGLQKEIDGGGNNWKDEYRFLKADGTYAYVTDRAVVIRDEAGEAYRMIGSLRDVTDRKVAEIKIQESEARYRQIVETAQEGIWTVDKDNKTLFVNKKMCTMLEYSYDEMIGRKNTDFMDEEGKIIMIENRAKRIAGIDEHIEMCLTTKNGRIIWVSVAITSNSDNKNNSFGSMAMVTDITNRKRSEEQLKRSNERFRLLVDNVKDYAVYVINTDGIILTWNSGAEKMKGYTSEEITGKSFSIFYTQEQRDNEEHLRSLETVIQQGTYKTEGVRVRKDGSQFWAEVVLSAIYDDAKNLQGIAKITRNITEKKLAEQKFQEISERLSMATSVSNIGMWEWNFAQNTLEWDETSYRLFGLSGNGLNNPIEIINTYVHPEDRERLQETNARALKLQQRLEVDYRVIWPDNSIHHIESRAIVLKDTEGKSLKFLGTNSDITARKKNEESERELHYYIQLLLDSTGEGLFGIDKEGDCTFINKAAAAMLGYNPSDCIGKNMHEQIHYKERNGKACLKAASLINIATLEKRSCYSDSEVFWKADGSSFDVEYSCNPILVKNELKGSVITFNDITQRKKAEAQLIESEKNLNAILLSSNEGLYMLDNNFRLVLMNKANEAIMKQVTKMPCEPGDDFLACFEGDKRNGLRDVFDKVLQGEQIEAEIQMAKNGQELYYSATYFPVRAQNNVITNICCSYKNITDKRRNEEAIKAAYEEKEEFQYRFQAILDNSPQAVLVNDLNGKVTFVNKTFIEAFGYEGREILGKETGDVFNDPGVIEKFYATDDKVLAERKITEWEQKMTVSNGEERDVQITKFPLYDQREKVFGVGTICKDITEIKNYQYELIEAREKAESAERLQEQFLANMSHELRTPMNGIIGMTNVLSNTELQPQQMKHLQIIQHSSLILLDLINDILDLSKIKAGMLTIEKEDFDFNGTIASTTLSFKEKTVEKGIRFTVQTEPFIPRFLSGDPLRLVQILNNLLSNAIKFTEKGIVKLEASLLSKTEGEVIIEFVISDSGIGIQASKIKGIFNSFEQASPEIARKYGGTGLGLPITKKLIELQGGEITVRSVLGTGSIFTFSLPYGIPKIIPLPALNQSSSAISTNEKKDYSGKKVLIVEDNEINQEVLAATLKQYNMSFTIMNNGKEAVEELETGKHYDLIFMDLRMPVMNGFQATAYIREKLHLKIPIVILTASVLRNERERCISMGASEYLAKPFNHLQLQACLVKYFENNIGKNIGKEKSKNPLNGSTSNTYNITHLLELEEEESIRHVLQLFIQKIPVHLQELRNAASEMNTDEFLERAHKFRGSLSIIQVPAISDLAVSAEGIVRLNKDWNSVLPLLDKALVIHTNITPEIASEVERQIAEINTIKLTPL